MTPERLREIERLFHEARERPPAERAGFLSSACGADPTLRHEVESLLAQPPAGLIDAPVGALVAGLVPPASVLAGGRRLGVFEVQGLLGVGGMGEVYRARDTRLGREVAIKILPRAFKDDPERLARFEREARVLASLNHPHIGAIYGLEEADDITALVMELVEGDDLSQRIGRGAIPIAEALPIARQVAEALEAAHDQGIIHRDLKPANIKVRADGTVKVLDFGLAKALDPTGSSSPSLMTSPTLSLATQAGVLLGTAAYMPPEQAKGRPVDRRADLWSFGCVFFEMLTGRRPFEGETISDVLARIIERDPDWTALPAKTPVSIRTLLRRCLEKDPKRRLDSAAVVRLEIEEAATGPMAAGLPASEVSGGAGWRLKPLVAVAVLAAIVGAATMWIVERQAPAPPISMTRFAITLPPAQPLAFSINDRDIALSTDGTRLAYTAGDGAQLMVRALDQLDAVPLAGIANARAPFLSPDGRWIGFFNRFDEGVTTGPVTMRGALRKASISGGPPITICTVTGASRGASWGPDDSIVFATSDLATGLLRVRASGGEPEVLTTPDATRGERDHYFPSVLPGNRGVLFTIATGGARANRQVAVLDLKNGQRKTLIRTGSQAEYVETGHLIYIDDGTLWAVRFDLATLSVLGDPAPLIEHVLTLGAADFTVSRRGTLIHVPAGSGTSRSLVWVSRQGAEEPIAAPAREYVNARLSPDGKRVALHIRGQGGVWIWDFARGTLMPLILGAIGNFSLWEPDGQHVIFEMSRDEAPAVTNLYRRAVNGTGIDERLTTSARSQRPNAISPDGSRVVLEEQTQLFSGYHFVLLSLTGTPRADPLGQTTFDERNAAISPDGRWMAYESTESGQSQVYVRPFPNVADARYQISTSGGRTPAWAPDGHDLFFVSRTSLIAVTVQLTPAFSAGSPTKLFDTSSMLLDGRLIGGGTQRAYDVSRDGRFLMIKEQAGSSEGNAPPASMVVVQNWFEELKAKLPVNR